MISVQDHNVEAFIYYSFSFCLAVVASLQCAMYSSVKTESELKVVFGCYLSIHQNGPKIRKFCFYFSAHMKTDYLLLLHHQWLVMPAKCTHFQEHSKNLETDATAFQIKYEVFLSLFNASSCLILIGINKNNLNFLL